MKATVSEPGLESPQARPRIHPDVILDRVDERVILLHPLLPRWTVTNATGLALVRLMDGSRTTAELSALVASRYGIEPEEALEDLRRFLGELLETDLLESHPLPERRKPSARRTDHRLSIYLTEECNLRCKHCFVVEGRMPKPALSADAVRALIDDHLGRHPGSHVSFTGGEPFLRDDCLELLEYAHARAGSVGVNTNGLLLDERAIEVFARLPNLNVQVSLDGAREQTHDFIRGAGTFAKAFAAIERLADAGLGEQVRTSTTLTKCGIGDVRALVERMEALGVQTARFLILNRLKAAATNWEAIAPEPAEMLAIYHYLLMELPRRDPPLRMIVKGEFPGFVPEPDPTGRHWCPLGEAMIVDSQGHTYPCPMLLTPEYRTGNVREEPLGAIHTNERTRELREQMLQRRYVIDDCRSCAWRNFCQGGCQGYMELRTGSTWVTDEFCDFRRALYREHVANKAAENP